MDGDGHIQERLYPNAATFVREMKQRMPDLKILAWIGQTEKEGGGPLDMADSHTRINIVAEAQRFSQVLGFDGIHRKRAREPLACEAGEEWPFLMGWLGAACRSPGW